MSVQNSKQRENKDFIKSIHVPEIQTKDIQTGNIDDMNIDVMAQFCRDGGIIPLRIRVTDEDGEWQQYRIKQYRDISDHEDYFLGTKHIKIPSDSVNRYFECKIETFNRLSTIVIFFIPYDHVWRLARR